MRQIKSGFLIALVTIFSYSFSFAQSTVSPYSAYGIGIMAERSYAPNLGMGGAGLAYSSPWFIPALNPALLGSQSFSSFEAGITIRNTAIRDEINRFDQVNGGLQYVALALPIVQGKYGISLSLNPYSSKSYSLLETFDETDVVRPLSKSFTGEGNISQFRLSNGWNINKNISVGAEANYNFGVITERSTTRNIIDDVDTIALPYLVASQNVNNYADVSFLIGVRLRKNIKKNTLALGATYSFQNDLNTTKNNSLEYLSLSGDPINRSSSLADSSNFRTRDLQGVTTIPAKLSVGLSYYRQGKWAIAVDYSYQDWSNYALNGSTSPNLQAANALNLGGEYTPNIQSGSKYFERVTYRAGFYSKNGPIIIDNTQINSFGVTFGATLPISKVSNINIGLEVGQRGTLENALVRENYFGIYLSFTYNDRWFIRRQFD